MPKRTRGSSEPGQSSRTYTPPTSAALTKLVRQSAGPVVIQSGTVQASPHTYYSWPIGWAGDFFSITAPPPEAQILWFTIAFDWRLWEWRYAGPKNSTNKSLRIDFGINWEYELVPNPFYTTSPGRFMRESDRHEGYTSVSPNSSGFNAGWVVPANSVTLTPDSKESSPTPLQLLLAASVNGVIRLAYRWRTSNEVIRMNGKEIRGWAYGIYGGVDYIHYSYAMVLPKVSIPTVDVGPVMEE
jgi:hypothetical protein